MEKNLSEAMLIKQCRPLLNVQEQSIPSKFLNIFIPTNPNLGRLFRGLFWGGGDKITPSKTC